MKLRRPLVELKNGSRIKSADYLDLYPKATFTGRVMPLRKVDENSLGIVNIEGQNKAGERKIVLTPSFPLQKVMSGDFIAVPWGNRPNTWIPPNVPEGTGYNIWIDTPTGNQYLTWIDNKFINDNLEIYLDDVWMISGEVDFEFETDETFVTQTFPEGYSFLRASGPMANFEIIRMDEQQDHLGRTAFYTCSVEHIAHPDMELQE